MDKKRVNVKRKGSQAERLYAIKFREAGYQFCKTARFGSKLHDDAKIDLIFIPYNVQIKAGKQTSMNVGKELTLMKESIEKVFPKYEQVHVNPCVLIHYEEVGRGKKRLPENEKVYMSSTQFHRYKLYDPDLEYQGSKIHKNVTGEFNETVWITFETFRNQIILKYVNNNPTDGSGPVL